MGPGESTGENTNFTHAYLWQIVGPALDFISVDLIRKYIQRGGEYKRAYLEGKKAGKKVR